MKKAAFAAFFIEQEKGVRRKEKRQGTATAGDVRPAARDRLLRSAFHSLLSGQWTSPQKPG